MRNSITVHNIHLDRVFIVESKVQNEVEFDVGADW